MSTENENIFIENILAEEKASSALDIKLNNALSEKVENIIRNIFITNIDEDEELQPQFEAWMNESESDVAYNMTVGFSEDAKYTPWEIGYMAAVNESGECEYQEGSKEFDYWTAGFNRSMDYLKSINSQE